MESEALRDDTQLITVGEVLAEIMDKALMRRLHERVKDGARIATFGGKGIIKYGATTDDIKDGIREEETIIEWKSPSGLPETVTIEVGIIANGGGGSFPRGTSNGLATGTPLAYRAQAMVLLGTPATICDPFFFDIGRGRRFMLSGTYLAVTAQMLAPPPTYTSGSLAVYGALGLGSAFSGSESLYSTVYVDNIQSGETRNIPVPSRAVTIEDFVTVSPTVHTLNLLDASGRVLRTINTALIGTRANAVSLSGDCTQVQIVNGLGSVTNMEVLFGLLM